MACTNNQVVSLALKGTEARYHTLPRTSHPLATVIHRDMSYHSVMATVLAHTLHPLATVIRQDMSCHSVTATARVHKLHLLAVAIRLGMFCRHSAMARGMLLSRLKHSLAKLQ